ncbi:MAG: hypothetical protein LBG43_05660 [Treponema sp.]|nr:hypothetical protein [Treponema sp.]
MDKLYHLNIYLKYKLLSISSFIFFPTTAMEYWVNFHKLNRISVSAHFKQAAFNNLKVAISRMLPDIGFYYWQCSGHNIRNCYIIGGKYVNRANCIRAASQTNNLEYFHIFFDIQPLKP